MSEGLPTADGAPVTATIDEREASRDGVAPPGETAVEQPMAADDAQPLADLVQPPTTRRSLRRRARPTKQHSASRQLLSWVLVLGFAAACAVGLRAFVVQTFFVPSGSMTPTLQIGDRILVLKIGYTIHRGEIVVFRRPPGDKDDPNNEDLVKRVIGLPGETIWSKGNTVFIDGKALPEPYLPNGVLLGTAIPTTKIPAGDYYMLGDDRNDSADSRFWTPHFLPRSYIVGEVILVVWRHGRPAFHSP